MIKELLLCDGKYKIVKLNELNWTIHEKSDSEYYNTEHSWVEKKTGKTRYYKPDGYKQYGAGVYFGTLDQACAYVLKHIAIEEGEAEDLQGVIDAIKNAEENIIREVKEQLGE